MKKILINQTAFIGDVILITPLIRSTKELYPQAEIDALVVPAAAKLLENNPYIRHVYHYNKRQRGEFLKTCDCLNEKYDGYSPHSSTYPFFIYLHRTDWVSIVESPRIAHAKIKHPKGYKSQKNLAPLSLISQREFSLQTELFPSAQNVERVRNMLLPLRGKRLIALAPGSVWGTKRWPIEYYIQLCVMLDELGFGLVLTGSAAEKDLCDQILLACPNAVSLCGETDLLESAAAIKEAELSFATIAVLDIAMMKRLSWHFVPLSSIGYFPFVRKITSLKWILSVVLAAATALRFAQKDIIIA